MTYIFVDNNYSKTFVIDSVAQNVVNALKLANELNIEVKMILAGAKSVHILYTVNKQRKQK